MNNLRPSIVRWLEACFREDRTRVGVTDFFGSKVELDYVMSPEEMILTGVIETEVISGTSVIELLERSTLYRREKEVVYGSFFVCGTHEAQAYCAPLVFFNVELEACDEAVSLHVQLDQWRLNWGLIDALDDTGVLAEKLSYFFGSHEQWGVVEIGDLRKILAEIESIDSTEGLLNWPYLDTAKQLKKGKSQDGLSVRAGSALGMMDRSRGARGVIEELSMLGKLDPADYSSAMKGLFAPQPVQEVAEDDPLVPLVLSESQKKVVQASRSQALTVCHGPPGTGKSMTIAAVAVDHVSRGESVLVVSKMDHAVEVVEHKIDDMVGGAELTVRAGRSRYLAKLQSYLEQIISGAVTTGAWSVSEVDLMEKALKSLIKDISRLEGKIEQELTKSIERGEMKSKVQRSVIESIQVLIADWCVKRRPLISDFTDALLELDKRRDKSIKNYLMDRHLAKLEQLIQVDYSRAQLAAMRVVLKRRRSSDQAAVMGQINFESLLWALPVWLCKLDDLHRVLPMQKEMFDVVIIDEASQCDIASMLPALQRAKRVVVAGDSKQLRHISFVSEMALRQYAREYQLSEPEVESLHYRKVSLMDVAIEQSGVTGASGFLNEHFRSLEPIIRFSKEQFYDGRLSVMRHRDWESCESVLNFHACAGIRDEDGVNQNEIDQVFTVLKSLLDAGGKLRDGPVRSIGILSPFRKQVDAIAKQLRESFSRLDLGVLMSRHELMISTPHGFQGEERDVMLISMAIGPTDGKGVQRYVEREDVFNVSITRAKERQDIFCSVDVGQLSAESLLGRYLVHGLEYRVKASEDSIEHDAFSREVADAVTQLGASVLVSRFVAGCKVDLVLTKGDRTIGVDLVGYPGDMADAVSVSRMRLLARAGLILFPLGYTEWQTRKEACIEKFRSRLDC